MKYIAKRSGAYIMSLLEGARRRPLSLLLGLALICLLSKVAVVVYAQVCAPSTATSWMVGKTRDQQGLIHVTVNYNGGGEGAPNATMLRLMQEAIAEWNTFKCWTGVSVRSRGRRQCDTGIRVHHRRSGRRWLRGLQARHRPYIPRREFADSVNTTRRGSDEGRLQT